MGTYFPLSNNPRRGPTTVYLRDRLPDPQPDPTFPESSIMYPNYPCIDSASSQQEILLNFGAIEGQWKDSREEILMVQGPPEGLSLSLSRNEHHPVYYQSHHDAASGFSSVLGHDGDYVLPSGSANPLDSKYLRAARELLDTVVSVGRDRSGGSECSKGSGERVSVSEPSAELSVVADKQELQSRLSKLLAMLDEVDRRYRQYYHQMQAVVASFDVIVGPGASRPYTSLALHTISRHFRCLRDAINSQIAAARRCLGEEAVAADRGGIGISRLRYVDKQLRQQRALQQLGIMQQHAWRPQRGLPETSVSVLRAWLFEHFLHPYPKDSEKIMLARQAGLTRSQVSNWFINARVRLWKPMVEEMYKEEADADVDSNSSSKGEDSLHATSSAGPHLVESKSPAAGIVGPDDAPLLREGQNGIFADVSAAYHMSGFGGVDPVSLTLGLQQGEGGGFHPLCGGVGYDDAAADMADEVAEFDYMDSGNRQHQLVSSLLPSFS